MCCFISHWTGAVCCLGVPGWLTLSLGGAEITTGIAGIVHTKLTSVTVELLECGLRIATICV